MVGGGSTRDMKRVVPFGGGAGAGVLGTNPIAIAFPGKEEPAIVIDMATSGEASSRKSSPINPYLAN